MNRVSAYFSQPSNRALIRKALIRGLLLGALIIGALAAFLRFVVTPIYVPTGSMLPTIKPGSYLFVNRLAYLFGRDGPQRGDIVLFKGADGVMFVKRVLALPGESVTIEADMKVRVQGNWLSYSSGREPNTMQENEWTIRIPKKPGEIQTFQVPLGHVFVMGDNRPASKDSRMNGPVALNQIEGRVLLSAHH